MYHNKINRMFMKVGVSFLALLNLCAIQSCTKGEAGVPGSSGEPGAPGAPGTPGVPGQSGHNGSNGANGNNGENGANGADGVNATEPGIFNFVLSSTTIGTIQSTVTGSCHAPDSLYVLCSFVDQQTMVETSSSEPITCTDGSFSVSFSMDCVSGNNILVMCSVTDTTANSLLGYDDSSPVITNYVCLAP